MNLYNFYLDLKLNFCSIQILLFHISIFHIVLKINSCGKRGGLFIHICPPSYMQGINGAFPQKLVECHSHYFNDQNIHLLPVELEFISCKYLHFICFVENLWANKWKIPRGNKWIFLHKKPLHFNGNVFSVLDWCFCGHFSWVICIWTYSNLIHIHQKILSLCFEIKIKGIVLFWNKFSSREVNYTYSEYLSS